MQNIKKVSKSKIVVEYITAFILYVIYLYVLPVMYTISKVKKESLFVVLKNSYNLELVTFNTSFTPIKFLPLSRDILQGKLFFVGTNLNNSNPQKNFIPGVISLYELRSLSGINHVSVEAIDNEYAHHTNLLYDIKLSLRYGIALLFSSRKKSYLSHLHLMGVTFMNSTMQEVIEIIKNSAKNREKSKLYFINADTLNKVYENKALRMIFNNTPYVFPDGSGVKVACNMMNTPIKENVNGTDMFPFICQMAEKEGLKLFLYGAKEGVASQMKEEVLKMYPNLQIVGTMNGYDYHDNEVVNMINYTQADIVLVAKGAPLQEEWINKHSKYVTAPVMIGVGGLFDFYSGNIPRAPIWMREIGIEWIYRLLQEPQRMWRRYVVGNPLFLMRTYQWNQKQKQKKMKKYKEITSSKKVLNLVPDFSLWFYKLYPLSKRVLDFSATFVALLLLSPLMLVVATLIKLESRGPIFFAQKRVGKEGELFDMYKFRSMVQNAEALKKDLTDTNESEDGVIFKMKDDPRITKVGKFIRRWSIDELPQLFNVLKGDMSLVGPRPPVPSEVSEYINDELKRLHILPGLTCYWQVSGRSDIPFKQQVALDVKYISNRSLWTDIKILLLTIPAILSKKGAY
jgi:exopolysaccharide biosynthesis WecB/TagA/CpsF family protein